MGAREQAVAKILVELQCKTSYRRRLHALNKSVSNFDLNKDEFRNLGDKTVELALSDKVFDVRKAAIAVCQNNKLTKSGMPIALGKKFMPYKPNEITDVFLKIKRDNNMKELNLKLFKEQFQLNNPEMFDVMSYEKKKLDAWIISIFTCLPSR